MPRGDHGFCAFRQTAGRAVAVATAAGKRYTFLPIGVSALAGSGVEQVVREAGRTSSQAPARVVVARTLSPRVRGELDAAEVSWVDHEGAGRIVVTPGLYLARAVEGCWPSFRVPMTASFAVPM